MQVYKTKTKPLSGTSYTEIKKKAFGLYKEVRKKSKRKPYVKSAFFKRDKVFLEMFWEHLFQKNFWDQMRRMKFFACGLELIQKSTFIPTSKENPNKKTEILHRFAGITPNGKKFYVQIKEEKSTGKKFLISIFPLEKQKRTLR